jgi:hypothetical protein
MGTGKSAFGARSASPEGQAIRNLIRGPSPALREWAHSANNEYATSKARIKQGNRSRLSYSLFSSTGVSS